MSNDRSGPANGGKDQAKNLAGQMIVDAKKYKINIEKPKGTVNENHLRDVNLLHYELSENQAVGSGQLDRIENSGNMERNCYPANTVDDQFFHITCHVDNSL